MEIKQDEGESRDTTNLLYEASLRGCVSSLNTLIQKDPLILQKISLTTFTETPLHVSALIGHLEFTNTILSHNPKLATELDSYRRLPLHLASAQGHQETVQVLLRASVDACLFHDDDGKIPLHYAAMRGRVEVLKELIQANPESVSVRVLNTGETVLHLCVTYNNLECLKLLVREVGEDSDFLNSRDFDGGKTILHLALMLKQVQTTRYLLSLPIIRENADVVNSTLFNTLEHGPRDFRSLDIQQILMDAGINRNKKNENEQPVLSTLPLQSKSTVVGIMVIIMRPITWLLMKLMQSLKYKKDDHWLEEMRGMLMVVATMISTMTFQAALNPPGGVWQENINSTSIGGETYCTENYPCFAGTAVLAYVWDSDMLKFMFYNTISFATSLGVTIFIVSGFPLTNRLCIWLLSMAMCVTITFTGLAYLTGMDMVMPYDVSDLIKAKYKPLYSRIWIGLLSTVGAFHTFYFLAWLVEKLMNSKHYKKVVNYKFRYKRPNMSTENGHTVA